MPEVKLILLLLDLFVFFIQYLLGKHTEGNKSHKLVTEVVPNPKKSNYIEKIIHTVI